MAWQSKCLVEIQRFILFNFLTQKEKPFTKYFLHQNQISKPTLKLVELYKNEAQEPILGLDISPEQKSPELPDNEIDVKGFQEAWKNLQDTHDFFGMLRKFNVSRTQGLRLAPEGFTAKVDNSAVVKALEMAVDRNVSIMCFLHSKGCVQIHTEK